MKKVYLALALTLCAIGVQAQEYNLFRASDVDANGWLWFDSQEKVDRYVGTCNEEDYKVDPESKIIQLVYADQVPTYPETTVDPTAVGYGKEGNLGAEGAKTGAIILPAATALGATNGGGFVVCMPSCSTFSMNVSCEGGISCQLMSSDKIETVFSDYGVRQVYLNPFKKFAGAGNTTVTGLETKTNGTDNITIKSDKPVYVYFRSNTKNEIFVHGIKVTTPKQETTGISLQANSSVSAKEVYTIDGIKVGNSLKGLKGGLYIVKDGDKVRKVTM